MTEPQHKRQAIRFVDVSKTFTGRGRTQTVIEGLDLSIFENEFYSLLGPSGCGKTTALRMIACFEQPSGGDILIDGESVIGVPPYRRNVNMVFQSYSCSETQLMCRYGGANISVLIPERLDVKAGTTVRITPKVTSPHLFDRRTGTRM